MRNGIFIIDQEYSFQESAHHLARVISMIVDEKESGVFSVTDVLCLLSSVNEYVPGEFEIQRTASNYYRVVYKSENEVVESFKERWENFMQ